MLSKEKIQHLVSNDTRSMNQIAKDAGISHVQLHKLLTGKTKNMYLTTAFKLADALGVDINEFREEK